MQVIRDELNKSLQDCKTESSLAVRIDDVMLAISHLKPDKCDGNYLLYVNRFLNECLGMVYSFGLRRWRMV